MLLIISKETTIQELQQKFCGRYPFLKLEFYKLLDGDPAMTIRKHLAHTAMLGSAGLKTRGVLEIRDDMSVAYLERLFLEQFGLEAQVSRKAGNSWLETTLTDNWTLQKQNDQGREISSPVVKYL